MKISILDRQANFKISDISEIGLGILMNQTYNEHDETRVRIDDLSDLYQLSGGL